MYAPRLIRVLAAESLMQTVNSFLKEFMERLAPITLK
jgi:hypothetical protein